MLGGKVSRRRLGEEVRQPLGMMPITYSGGGIAGAQRQRAQANVGANLAGAMSTRPEMVISRRKGGGGGAPRGGIAQL